MVYGPNFMVRLVLKVDSARNSSIPDPQTGSDMDKEVMLGLRSTLQRQTETALKGFWIGPYSRTKMGGGLPM